MKWWDYRQNNSGGYWLEDENVQAVVIVQANSAKEADAKMEAITQGYNEFCPCCGERWSIYAYEVEGTEEPTIYGEPLENYRSGPFKKSAILYYADGRKEIVECEQ